MAYATDTYAREKNIEVLRLPPYHCKLNPIEMIWGQVKGYVAGENKTFKNFIGWIYEFDNTCSMAKMHRPGYTRRKEMRELDGMSDNVIDEFIIQVSGDTSSISDSDSDDNEWEH